MDMLLYYVDMLLSYVDMLLYYVGGGVVVGFNGGKFAIPDRINNISVWGRGVCVMTSNGKIRDHYDL